MLVREVLSDFWFFFPLKNWDNNFDYGNFIWFSYGLHNDGTLPLNEYSIKMTAWNDPVKVLSVHAEPKKKKGVASDLETVSG